MEPPPPLWDSGMYTTIAVLPIRVEITTGAPPFTSKDSDLSSELSGKMTEAAAVALRYKGYDLLAPLDINEKIQNEKELSRSLMELAALSGLLPEVNPLNAPEGVTMADASAHIGQELGADILVLGTGNGEFHGFGENVLQGVLTGILTKGKKQYEAPPSFLKAHIVFIDAANGAILTRFYTRQMSWTKETIPLARMLDRQFRRVPVKVREPVSK